MEGLSWGEQGQGQKAKRKGRWEAGNTAKAKAVVISNMTGALGRKM